MVALTEDAVGMAKDSTVEGKAKYPGSLEVGVVMTCKVYVT